MHHIWFLEQFLESIKILGQFIEISRKSMDREMKFEVSESKTKQSKW